MKLIPRRDPTKPVTNAGLRKLLVALIGLIVFVAFVVGGGTAAFYVSDRNDDRDSKAQDDKIAAQVDELAVVSARLDAALAALEEARAESKSNVCGQDYNAALTAINTLGQAAEDQAREFVNQIYDQASPPPALDARIDRFITAMRRVAEVAARKTNKLRDCSGPGIVDFYSNAPPAQPCTNGTDGKGYCR